MPNQSKTYYLSSNYPVLAATIRYTSQSTADTDTDGVLTSVGTQRVISWGITPDGSMAMWVDTNGDPVPITPQIDIDTEAALAALYDLGDSPDDPITRITTGLARLRGAIAEVEGTAAGMSRRAINAISDDIYAYEALCARLGTLVADAELVAEFTRGL